MTKSMRTLLMGAAMAGFVAGTNAVAQDNSGANKDNQQKTTTDNGKKAAKPKIEKHACKGQNSCKGKGGGATAGKNECKGKGDCRTDGKKPKS